MVLAETSRMVTEREGAFGFGLGLLRRIGEHIVNRFLNVRHIVGCIRENIEDADIALAAIRQTFFDVGFIEIENVVVDGSVVNAADGEFEISRIDVAHQSHAVAIFQREFVGQFFADQASAAVVQKSGFLLVGDLHFRTDGKELVPFDGESRELMLRLRIDVRAAIPVGDHHFVDAGYRLDLLLVRLGHHGGEANLVARDET